MFLVNHAESSTFVYCRFSVTKVYESRCRKPGSPFCDAGVDMIGDERKFVTSGFCLFIAICVDAYMRG